MDQNRKMNEPASRGLEPNPIHEKLRSDQERMEHLTKSFVAGLEQLGRDNTNLAIQLSEQHNKNVSMVNEIKYRHKVSVETQKKLDEALRVNNQLRAELLGCKSVNNHLGQQYNKAQGMETKLRMELDAAQNEVNRLKKQLDGLGKVTESPANNYSQLWPHGIGNALPTPPLAARSASPPLASSASNGSAFFNLPQITYNNNPVGPQTDHPNTMVLKPKPNGFVRGGPLVDESFARLKKNLALANNVGASSHTKSSDASQSDSQISHSLRDFSWPQATPIHHVKKPLNPECVPSALPDAQGTLTSKLNPFSQEFVPAMKPSKENVPPPYKRIANPHTKGEVGSPLRKATKMENLPPPHMREAKLLVKKEVSSPSNQATEANAILDSTTPQSFKAELSPLTSKESHLDATTQLETTAIKGFGNSRESLLPTSKAKGSSSGATDNVAKHSSSVATEYVAIAKVTKPIPPHLRGFPPKAAAQKLEPAETPTSSSTAKTTDTVREDAKLVLPESESLKTWLDDLEQKPMGQSVLDERSDSTPSTPPSEKLIDLDNDDDEKSPHPEDAPGFTLEALQGILDKTKSTGATPISKVQQTMQSFLETLVSHPAALPGILEKAKSTEATPHSELEQSMKSLLATAMSHSTKAQSESDVAVVLQGIFNQFLNKHHIPTSMEEAQISSEDEDEDDTTSSFKDPYLELLSRGPRKILDARTGYPNNPGPNPDTFGAFKDPFGSPDEENKAVSDFKARLPDSKNESSINADFLAAYSKKLSGVQSKYVKPAKTQTAKPALQHNNQYFDPDYVAPKIIGTRKLGTLLDEDTRAMVVSDTPRNGRWDLWVQIEWKPVVRGGKTVYVL